MDINNSSTDSKTCSKCKETKLLSEYRKSCKARDGLQSACKECQKVVCGEWRKNNRDKHNSYNLYWRSANPDKVKIIRKRGYQNNREKNLAYAREWAAKNKDKITAWNILNKDKLSENARNYRKRHPEKVLAYKIKWYQENPDKKKSIEAKASKKWASINQDKKNAQYSRYRASKLKATPSWGSHKYIGLFYKFAQIESNRTGTKIHVDHIVPLQSEIVCGLHCEDNLQLLHKSDNHSKCNRYWPDMP